MSERPKRKPAMKPEVPIKVPRKWEDEEMETLLSCVMEYGHKNLKKIKEHLPGRSIENIKIFLRTVHDTAGKFNKDNENIDFWIKHSGAFEGTPWRDCLQIAQVLKYLSVDGLLENHPLPERCEGIDFRQAYRLVYQAMMGYPIQPVNKPTADFVVEALAELSGEIKKQNDVIKNVDSFLNIKFSDQEPNSVVDSEFSNKDAKDCIPVKKPLKVYQRKKTKSSVIETVPSLKIVVEEKPGCINSGLGCSKNFSVTVEGKNSCESTTVNVPVPCEISVDENEETLLKSSSYNPFQIPVRWLEEPLYINLVQKL